MDAFDFNFAHALGLFATTSKAGEAFETREFLLTHNKGRAAELNPALLKQPHYKLPRAIDRMVDHYARARLPFRVHVAVDDPAINAELSARGFARQPDLPCMVLAGAPQAEPIPGLTVRCVDDAETLADFQRVAFESFGYAVEYAPLALTDALANLDHAALFVGYAHDVPSACSALIVTADVAGIYWVGTVAAQRGKGLGGALTAHAVNAGYARGCRRACLQATPFGAPVYRRLGFSQPRAYVRFDHA